MKFSVLMTVLTIMIKVGLKRHKYLRDMISVKNHKIVMMTRDGKSGKRFVIKAGDFSVDEVLNDFDLAYVWKDGDVAFKTMTSNDPVAMHRAMANWDLEMVGDESISLWFTIFLGYATGMLKRSK